MTLNSNNIQQIIIKWCNEASLKSLQKSSSERLQNSEGNAFEAKVVHAHEQQEPAIQAWGCSGQSQRYKIGDGTAGKNFIAIEHHDLDQLPSSNQTWLAGKSPITECRFRGRKITELSMVHFPLNSS